MTGNAINAKSEALELHELSSEQLDAVSGGFYDFGGYAWLLPTRAVIGVEQCYGGGGGMNDPAQMFQQIMQQLTQGG
jgi:hypothetical protein